MTETRSASQILFGFLPEQTVDLKGQIWKVREWRAPIRETSVDLRTLRRELRRLAAPWRATQKDGGYVSDLERNRDISVYRLDRANGVELEPFPKVWLCKGCKTMLFAPDQKCSCGFEARPRQLQFVGYCSECGAIRTPYVPRCPTHQKVKVEFPGTATAAEINFACPVCQVSLRRGFGFAKCSCDRGQLKFNVHRAAAVYTPRSVVVVNPPSPERLQLLMAAGGAPRALGWVLDGMEQPSVSDIPLTQDVLKQQLIAQKVPLETIEAMLAAAASAGGLKGAGDDLQISPERLDAAQEQAVTIALACSESRKRVADLIDGTTPLSELGVLYRDKYRVCMDRAGIHDIELCDKFPVLTGMFGYTRGDPAPGASRLMAFRERNGSYRVYADVAETEALFVRLKPQRVCDWLTKRGVALPRYSNDRIARVAVLESCVLPDSSGGGGNEAGEALLTLVHSVSHRLIRLAALHSGIERSALSELLVPLHLGFYIYAAARGDFVLGGLQAVFESELDRLLEDFVYGEHRCALDPGCRTSGGACMACLHLGEPSCRYFNTYLDRNVLVGQNGYLEL